MASLSKEEDSIFIPARCEAQEVTLTFIFTDDSSFQINGPTLKLPVQAFTENKECWVVGEGRGGSKSVVAGFVVASIFAIIIVVIVIIKRKSKKNEEQTKTDENPIYRLYATNSQENLPTESEVIDENDYYGN